MERKRTLTMDWDALGDHDDDDDAARFFETHDRLSSAVPLDSLDSSGSEDDDELDDPRASFASAISSVSAAEFRNYGAIATTTSASVSVTADYNIWMAAPGSISERRKRLLQGMGLSPNGELLQIASSNKLSPNRELLQIASSNKLFRAVSNKTVNANGKVDGNSTASEKNEGGELSKDQPSHSPVPLVLVRSRSEGDIESLSIDKKRRDQILGLVSKQRLTRNSSTIIVSNARAVCPYQESVRIASPSKDNRHRPSGKKPSKEGRGSAAGGALTSMPSDSRFGAFFLIKNLDTGKEFIVNEYDQDGMWNRVSDLQTGEQLTLEEFEKCVGHSSVVKELMRRENVNRMKIMDQEGQDRKINTNSYFSKSLRISKRKGAALLKNIKGVAHSMSISASKGEHLSIGITNNHNNTNNNNSTKEKEREAPGAGAGGETKQGWVKVRQTGRSYKELSALHLCQEIQAHEGSIWVIRFSSDGRFLASGGEDRVVHVWEVQECEVMSLNEGNLSAQLSPSLSSSSSAVAAAMAPGIGEVNPLPSERRKKKKGSKKGNPIPEYVHVPETVFSLSEKPTCSFTGHLDDVLDLSWSRSQLLLSSSMDKTVRLWDLETKSCLKLFAHNDYVTCIQFNPMDDNYFISGSLDAKVRIWSIPDRQLVDWTDLYEMVTAVCFTPDGQGALVGSHKGGCRMYRIEDNKMNQMERIALRYKKKSQAKKITGFQFSPGNPSEVLVTSADSRIRILDGSEVVHKFKGFRNLNSQISASFSLDGKYVICASEDSHVFVWKREEPRTGNGKGKSVVHTRSHESFQCKDVSVAIPWPGTVKGDPPPIQVQSKRHSKRISASQTPSATPSASGSPTKEEAAAHSKRRSERSPSGSPTTMDENSPAANSKRQLPPRPKKKDNSIDRATSPPEEDLSHIASSESGVGASFTSSSSSMKFGDSPSISAAASSSRLSSWSWLDGSGQGNHTTQATAWGLVIVTATLGGEIRAYQNFGLPRRIGRL